MKWKLLALDLDGTTLNSSEQISDTNISAIQRASQAGIRVIVTTGRSYTSASRFIHRLGTTDPTITYNGALIRNGTSVLRSLTLEGTIVRDTLTLLKELGQSPVVYSVDDKRYVDEPEKLIPGFFEFSKGSGIENIQVADLMSQCWEHVIRVSVFTDETTTQKLDEELGRRLVGSIKTAQTYFSDWNFWIFEVLNPECSKPKALQYLCDLYGFDREEVIAVGDNRNDVEMLDWAGMGVAMRNSLPDVLRHADYVTTRDNNEHGVAEVIDRFILSG